MKDKLRSIILALLTLEARAVLLKHTPKIVVVTGSVGKTSTKDAVFSALKDHVFVRKSEKSFNSDIGVPLTILGVPNGWSNVGVWAHNLFKGLLLILSSTPYPKWLVIEIGADRPGDISKSLLWVKPDIVVATRFPDVPVHVEFYASPEEVIREEQFPLTLLENGGTAVINADYPHLEKVELKEGVRLLKYGFNKSADVRGMRYRMTVKQGMPTGISFDIVYGEEKTQVQCAGAIGMGHAYAILAGVAAGLAAGISLEEAAQGFKDHMTPPGRSRLILGKKKSVILDDSYNSSPAAVEEALHTLSNIPRIGKRIAVLGDMLELGTFSSSEHTRLGEGLPQSADVLVTVGVRAKGFAEAALRQGMNTSSVHSFERGPEAALYILTILEAGDAVLVKGSQSMRMEKIVKGLMEDSSRAKELLCRQDEEWLSR